jgi:CTP:molybdopterin cytidylyltransferase MocA
MQIARSIKDAIVTLYCNTFWVGRFGRGEDPADPALFNRRHFAELMKLKGAGGAKKIIQKHFQKVHLSPFAEGKIDIDTRDDFARLQTMN